VHPSVSACWVEERLSQASAPWFAVDLGPTTASEDCRVSQSRLHTSTLNPSRGGATASSEAMDVLPFLAGIIGAMGVTGCIQLKGVVFRRSGVMWGMQRIGGRK